MGRKAVPTALKIIRGNPGHKPLPKGEPEPVRGLVECPAHLDSVARVEWERITPELDRLGLLTQVDVAALAAYCQAYSRWAQAEGVIAQEGITTTNPTTGATRIHPAVQIAKESMRLVREFMSEFGLSPATRPKVKGVGGSEKKSVVQGRKRA